MTGNFLLAQTRNQKIISLMKPLSVISHLFNLIDDLTTLDDCDVAAEVDDKKRLLRSVPFSLWIWWKIQWVHTILQEAYKEKLLSWTAPSAGAQR